MDIVIKNFKKLFISVSVIVAIILFYCFCLVTVPATFVGVKTTFGKIDNETTLPEGIHLVSPFTKVTLVRTNVQTAAGKASAASKDLQNITATITVNYHITPDDVIPVYKRNPNLNYNEQFVIPAINEILKSTIAQYSATDIIVKRQEMSDKFSSAIREKLETYYLTVDDVNIVDLDFSEVFNTAIEQKMKASQEAEKAKFELEKAELEAKQVVTKARGEAEAIRIKADAVRQNGGKDYVTLEAIRKWDGKLPEYYGSSSPMPLLNIGSTKP